ncbi:sigma factor sigX-regulated lipoprotein SrpA [Leptospira kmetyi]|uniref:sigma factor sigX-regulated lipoprotein SrpA n=1 Tax=Leptospira kmetyi TaxID=408139 RepID=UPI000288307C|nr:hypothetical protein LEP1GSC052_2974 [Leptospira kmetyi serovar Malaysia str. Bejo-Iso9]
MKQESFGRKIKILFFSVAVLLSVDCNKDKKNSDDLLLAAVLLNAGNAEFRLSDSVGLNASARTTSESRIVSSSYQNPFGVFLTDLGGDNSQNYGDGNADGFDDHFLTPKAVSMDICRIVAYKSVAKGGPAPGTETLENSNLSLFTMSKITGTPAQDGANVCAQGSAIVNLKRMGDSGFLRVDSIPSEELPNYDRIGIVVQAFTYYFAPEDVPENSYRYVSLHLNNVSSTNDDRGTITAKIFQKDCPASFLSSPDLFGGGGFNGPCHLTELSIDSSTGSLIQSLTSTNPTNNPEMFINPPSASTIANATPNQKLKFKQPASAALLASNSPFVLVLDFNTTTTGSGKFRFDVSVDKVLFWDSNSTNNVFSPQLDSADRPNATDGSDNLTNTSRRNLIFHLPTILGKTQ